ncbi:hypothetical protein Tco_1473797 [Tanacetum coccineum]
MPMSVRTVITVKLKIALNHREKVLRTSDVYPWIVEKSSNLAMKQIGVGWQLFLEEKLCRDQIPRLPVSKFIPEDLSQKSRFPESNLQICHNRIGPTEEKDLIERDVVPTKEKIL